MVHKERSDNSTINPTKDDANKLSKEQRKHYACRTILKKDIENLYQRSREYKRTQLITVKFRTPTQILDFFTSEQSFNKKTLKHYLGFWIVVIKGTNAEVNKNYTNQTDTFQSLSSNL